MSLWERRCNSALLQRYTGQAMAREGGIVPQGLGRIVAVRSCTPYLLPAAMQEKRGSACTHGTFLDICAAIAVLGKEQSAFIFS